MNTNTHITIRRVMIRQSSVDNLYYLYEYTDAGTWEQMKNELGYYYASSACARLGDIVSLKSVND